MTIIPFAKQPCNQTVNIRIIAQDDAISFGARVAWILMAHDYCTPSGECQASLTELASALSITPRHVSNLMRELLDAGYIRVRRESGFTNVYTLVSPLEIAPGAHRG